MTAADVADFDRARYMRLATFRRSGAEVATPVWFAAADGRLYVFTAEQSGKVKREFVEVLSVDPFLGNYEMPYTGQNQ